MEYKLTLEKLQARLYCYICGIVKEHSIKRVGDWEYYCCTGCGNVQSFRVR